ncbi:MAG TPA: hypothetical protein VNW54_09895 [Granulicella sp.]|nr:hypothetical protein [Granulicella sp.]
MLLPLALVAFPLTAPAQQGRLNGSLAATPLPPPSPAPPIPSALLSAKAVFLSNAGADSGLFPEPFSGNPDRGYAEFYAALKDWGQFTLVDDPASADLVFELQLQAPNGPTNANKQNGASDPLPMFKLVIFDRKTHYILWALTESIEPAILQKTHDRNFDMALATLTADLKRLISQPTPATP